MCVFVFYQYVVRRTEQDYFVWIKNEYADSFLIQV